MKQKIIDWKKKSRIETKPLPGDLYQRLLETVMAWFQSFHCMTVPAPSFHTYEKNYPIWEIAKQISEDSGIKLVKLFPKKSGKTKMHTFGSLSKKVQNIELKEHQFVFILDDVFTTGFTMRVSCEAVIKKNGYPCCLTIA